jgi:hypothetical protein
MLCVRIWFYRPRKSSKIFTRDIFIIYWSLICSKKSALKKVHTARLSLLILLSHSLSLRLRLLLFYLLLCLIFLCFSLSLAISLLFSPALFLSLYRHLSSFSRFYRAFLHLSHSHSHSLSLLGSSIYTVSVLYFTFQCICFDSFVQVSEDRTVLMNQVSLTIHMHRKINFQ